MKNKYLVIVVGTLLVISLMVGASYAYWMMTKSQTNENIVNTGCFSTSFTEIEGLAINLTSAFPMTDEDGVTTKPYEFTITNTCDTYVNYNINLEILNTTTLSRDLIKVVINDGTPKVVTDYPSVSSTIEGANSYELLSGGLDAEESKAFNFRMWINESGTLENSQNKIVSAKIVVATSAADAPASVYISNLNTESIVKDDLTGDVRYIGSNPNNYVFFNNELWRIIGVFETRISYNGQTEKLIKIIRNDSIGNYSWDSSELNVNNGYGINEWSQSDVMNLLNNGPYWDRTKGICYVGAGEKTEECDFSNTGLMPDSKLMIETVTWNIGTMSEDWNNISNTAVVRDFYYGERSDSLGNICSGTIYCNDQVIRSSLWDGNVGLMYPSDYGYATNGGVLGREMCLNTPMFKLLEDTYDECHNNNWLYNNSIHQWLLTPVSHSNFLSSVFFLVSPGFINRTSATDSLGVRPTVYLKSSLKIVSGDGSINAPFVISDNY